MERKKTVRRSLVNGVDVLDRIAYLLIKIKPYNEVEFALRDKMSLMPDSMEPSVFGLNMREVFK